MKSILKNSARESGNPPFCRRTFFKKALATAAGVSLVAAPWYGFFIEPNSVRFIYHQLPVPNLPVEWIGKKLVQVSDVHASKVVKMSFIRKAFEGINREEPDIIVFTGDYVTNEASFVSELAGAASELKVKPGGVKAAVPGNHDRWTSFNRVMGELDAAGFKVLVNESIQLGMSAPFSLLGLDDLWSGKPDFDAVIGGIDLSREASLLLSHNPDMFEEGAAAGITTILAGHTHGGQVVIPLIGSLITPSKFGYTQGFYRMKSCTMYVNRGLGVVSPPVRFCCPPEITVFTLVNPNQNPV